MVGGVRRGQRRMSKGFEFEGEKSMSVIKDFLGDEEGAVVTEYALMAALIALAVATGAGLLGNQLCGTFQGIATALSINIFMPPPNFAPCA